MSIVRYETVSIEFSPNNFGLKDVSFEVEPGEIVYITGPSGSGKTTLMRLLTKEYTPSAGEVYFRDEPIARIKQGQVHHHRRKIGVVFQDYRLIPEMNVWENIALPLSVLGKKSAEIESRVTDLLKLIKLPEKAFHFPSQLSGGEAQRVSIARSLAIGPELIFADEPTGNLDPETSHTIAKLLHKVNELGTTVLIATHDQEVLGHGDKHRRIKLDQGKLVSDNGPKKVPVSHKTKTTEPKTTHEGDEEQLKSSLENNSKNKTPAKDISDESTKSADATPENDDMSDKEASIDPTSVATPNDAHEAKSRLHDSHQGSIWSKFFRKPKKSSGEVITEEDKD